MMLCDHAQVADGKMFISGGGWSVTHTPTMPSGLAVLIQVPSTKANRKVKFKLRLATDDGEPVAQPGPTGQLTPMEMEGDFEVGRPAGLAEGTLLEVPFAFNIPPLFLSPGGYVWDLYIDDETKDSWQVSFQARANQVDLL
jgi:hypothetical protein